MCWMQVILTSMIHSICYSLYVDLFATVIIWCETLHSVFSYALISCDQRRKSLHPYGVLLHNCEATSPYVRYTAEIPYRKLAVPPASKLVPLRSAVGNPAYMIPRAPQSPGYAKAHRLNVWILNTSSQKICTAEWLNYFRNATWHVPICSIHSPARSKQLAHRWYAPIRPCLLRMIQAWQRLITIPRRSNT